MQYIKIESVRFKGKNNIKWDDVEHYLRDYAGNKYSVDLYGDEIQINAMFADEYTERLKGAYAKVKANMATVIPELIASASNRRWQENKEKKHNNAASKGWYRYDVGIEFPVSAVGEEEMRWNKYIATMVVRINDSGLYLYDIINIKKEASTPPESETDLTVKTTFF